MLRKLFSNLLRIKMSFLFTFFLFFSIKIYSCDFIAIMNENEFPLNSYPIIPDSNNDVTDFLDTFITFASEGSRNNDGYGIIGYENNNPQISESNTWYKVGFNDYYDPTDENEPLIDAYAEINNNPNFSILMLHARNGTGGEGNHPFLFETPVATFSLMHNGFINFQYKRKMLSELGEEWFNIHPSQWLGVYENSNSFIDSEIFFHFLMKYIIKNDYDVEKGLRDAMNFKKIDSIDMEYLLTQSYNSIINFVISDGNNLYVYRSTQFYGNSYNLSYENFEDCFTVIKTGTSLKNILSKNSLTKFSSTGDVEQLNTTSLLYDDIDELLVDLNVNGKNSISWSTNNSAEISQYLIYRGINQNFMDSEILHITNNNETLNKYVFNDENSYETKIYYWLQAVYENGDVKTSSYMTGYPTNQNEQNIDIQINPNPFKQVINLTANFPIYKAKIYNIKGQYVNDFELTDDNNFVWNGLNTQKDKVGKGIYFVKIQLSKKNVIKRFIKI